MDSEKLKEYQDMLTEGVQNVLSSDNWMHYLTIQSQFHSYSFNNVIMIMFQCPSATKIAGFNTWKKMGRYVKKGETSIKVFAPSTKTIEVEKVNKGFENTIEKKTFISGFHLTSVFDISQTDGEDLPCICKRIQGNDANARSLIDALTGVIDIPIVIEDMDSNGYFSPTNMKIGIHKDLSINHKAKTLAHEYGHYLVRKKGIDLNELLDDNEGSRSDLYGIEEIIVESSAFIVGQYYGLDTSEYSFEYITSWSGGDQSKIKKLGSTIQKLASEIITETEKFMQTENKEKELSKAI
jgi:hypothetical protein